MNEWLSTFVPSVLVPLTTFVGGILATHFSGRKIYDLYRKQINEVLEPLQVSVWAAISTTLVFAVAFIYWIFNRR